MTEPETPFFTHTYSGHGWPVVGGPGSGNIVQGGEPEYLMGAFHLVEVVGGDDPRARFTGSFAIIEGEGGKRWFVRDLGRLEKAA